MTGGLWRRSQRRTPSATPSDGADATGTGDGEARDERAADALIGREASVAAGRPRIVLVDQFADRSATIHAAKGASTAVAPDAPKALEASKRSRRGFRRLPNGDSPSPDVPVSPLVETCDRERARCNDELKQTRERAARAFDRRRRPHARRGESQRLRAPRDGGLRLLPAAREAARHRAVGRDRSSAGHAHEDRRDRARRMGREPCELRVAVRAGARRPRDPHVRPRLAVAHWLFGPIRRVFGWIRRTELGGGFVLDAPATFVWEHHNDVRTVLEIVMAPDVYFRSDYYADDERIEVTGTRGYARCNRISGRGVQEPSVVVYREGEMHAYHALPDEPPDAFAASAGHGIEFFRTNEGPLLIDGAAAREVLVALLAALESAQRGVPVDIT